MSASYPKWWDEWLTAEERTIATPARGPLDSAFHNAVVRALLKRLVFERADHFRETMPSPTGEV